jgi:hypothetical protein
MRVTVFVVILVLLLVAWGVVLSWSFPSECFSFARSGIVAADGGRLASFNDAYLVVRPDDPGAVFSLEGDGSLRLLPKGLYAGFEKIVLSRTFYAVSLSAARSSPWATEPAGKGAYFFSQRVDDKKLYLFIRDGVLTGDPDNKTALSLAPA